MVYQTEGRWFELRLATSTQINTMLAKQFNGVCQVTNPHWARMGTMGQALTEDWDDDDDGLTL